MGIETIVAVVAIVVVAIIIFQIIRRNRCEMCGGFFTIETNGTTYSEPFTKRESEYIPEKRITRHTNVTYRDYELHKKCKKCGHTFTENGQQVVDRKPTF